MIVAQIFWIVSAVLILYVGISFALEFLKTRKKFYMKNLLRLNQLYHHFTSNFLIIFMLFMIHFLRLDMWRMVWEVVFLFTLIRQCILMILSGQPRWKMRNL